MKTTKQLLEVHVSIGFVIEDGKLLVAKEEDEQTWGVPGGHIEKKDDFDSEKAVHREFKEEIGAELSLTKYLGNFAVNIDGNKVRVHCYLGKLASYDFVESENLPKRWVNANELYSLMNEGVLRSKVGYDVARKLLSLGDDFYSIIAQGVSKLPLHLKGDHYDCDPYDLNIEPVFFDQYTNRLHLEDEERSLADFNKYIAPIIERMCNAKLVGKTPQERNQEIIEYCHSLGYDVDFPDLSINDNYLYNVDLIAELDVPSRTVRIVLPEKFLKYLPKPEIT